MWSRHGGRIVIAASLTAVLIALTWSLIAQQAASPAIRFEKLDRAVADDFRDGRQAFRILVRTRPDATARVRVRLEGWQAAARLVSTTSRERGD